jgi:DNA-binding response OmpR family regulator
VAIKILDIDDDQDVLTARKLVLEHDGFEVIQTTNIVVAREILENESIDLIILDVMMQKDSDGFNFAQHIKMNEKFKEIPIIMVTAVSQRTPFKFDPETDGTFLPVEKFLEKPVDPDLLIATIKGLLKK